MTFSRRQIGRVHFFRCQALIEPDQNALSTVIKEPSDQGLYCLSAMTGSFGFFQRQLQHIHAPDKKG